MPAAMVRAWWSAPCDYAAQAAYFERRGLLGSVRLLIAGCTLLLAVIAALSLYSAAGPATPAARLITVAFGSSAVVWSSCWLLGRWPSRRTSIAFIIYADMGVTTVSASKSNALAGLFGLNLLLIISMYAKFFDGPKIFVAHTFWAIGWVLVLSLRIATGPHGDPILAVTKTLAALVVLGAVPIAVHLGVWVLRGDADAAMTDALSGLLNRRGLYLLFDSEIGSKFFSSARDFTRHAAVMVMVIDIDRFKEINDTFGHVIGDEVIIRTGRRIKSAVGSPALVARIGGEEFVVAAIAAEHEAGLIAQRVLNVIAASSDRAPVTASIGVASIRQDDLDKPTRGWVESLECAIAQADHALFSVKRAGGNAVAIFEPPLPRPNESPAI